MSSTQQQIQAKRQRLNQGVKDVSQIVGEGIPGYLPANPSRGGDILEYNRIPKNQEQRLRFAQQAREKKVLAFLLDEAESALTNNAGELVLKLLKQRILPLAPIDGEGKVTDHRINKLIQKIKKNKETLFQSNNLDKKTKQIQNFIKQKGIPNVLRKQATNQQILENLNTRSAIFNKALAFFSTPVQLDSIKDLIIPDQRHAVKKFIRQLTDKEKDILAGILKEGRGNIDNFKNKNIPPQFKTLLQQKLSKDTKKA